MTNGEARKLRTIVEQMAQTALTDDEALENVVLFPKWIAGVDYAVGTKVRYKDTLYKCLTAHTAQEDWTPDVAASLFAQILAGQDGTDVGEWVQPDSTNPYMSGDKVTHNGSTWESTIDNNVWEPGVYGWTEVS